jgi:putative Ca2+/H+ antiporter (TMEM165/GDT1 family)
MVTDFLLPFFLVALAEFGDKTQLSLFFLSSRVEAPFHLLLGATLAFALVDGVAIGLGAGAAHVLPVPLVKTASGIFFLLVGLWVLRGGEGGEKWEVPSRSSFLTGFSLILLTEWGDKTQIVAGVFAMRYDALWVFLGTVGALFLLSALAVFSGQWVSRRVSSRTLSRAAGAAFLGTGLFILLG